MITPRQLLLHCSTAGIRACMPAYAIIAACWAECCASSSSRLVVLVAAMFLLPRNQRGEAPQNATVLPEPRPLADVRFVDKSGRETRLSDLKGDFTLLFFGFTNCPDVCP